MGKRTYNPTGRPLIDLTGQQIFYLKVISRIPGYAQNSVKWLCECICGKRTETAGSTLRKKAKKSCGCRHAENYGTHHLSKTKEYRIWADMIKRCENSNHIGYKNYGGRGIKVSPEWRVSFETWLADVGPRPSPKHSLERENNEKFYEKGNVIWADRYTQSRNTRRTVRVTHQGKTQCLKDWAIELNLKYKRLQERMLGGLSFEEAISRPTRSSVVKSPDQELPCSDHKPTPESLDSMEY